MPGSDSGSSDGDAAEAFQALNGYDDAMGGGMPPKVEEHIFFATLSKDNKVFKFEGCDDAESTLILRRATLDAECEDDGRHVIQVISLDHCDNRTVGTLCSLKMNGSCTVALDGISVAPPTAFKLLKGDGPITICGNLMKEIDQDLLPDDEDELEEMDSAEEMVEESDDETPAISPAAITAKVASLKKADDKRRAKRKPVDDDSSTDSDSVDEATPSKKAKTNSEGSTDSAVSMNGDAKTNGDAKPEKGEKKEKREKNAKKEHRKFANVGELIAAVKVHKGGLPRKQAKFENWVKNTMKVDDKEWAKMAWDATRTQK